MTQQIQTESDSFDGSAPNVTKAELMEGQMSSPRRRFSRRELRGLGILVLGGQIERVNDALFHVRSQSKDISYDVKFYDRTWICTCEDYNSRKLPCKHIFAVGFLSVLPQIIIENSQGITRTCPHCGSNRIIRKGHPQRSKGLIQQHLCKDCGKKFVKGLGNESSTNAAIAIISLDLYFKKLSLREIRDHLWQIYLVKKSVASIHRLILKFVNIMISVAKEIRPKLGETWLADEMFVSVNKEIKYLWNVLDYETRYHIVSVLLDQRGTEEAKIAIASAIEAVGMEPSKLITDGLGSYSGALKELNYKSLEHVANVSLSAKQKNNNRIERLHNSIRSWERTKRGMKKEHAQELFEANRIYYDRIRPNMALNDLSPSKDTNAKWTSLLKS